MLEQERSVRGRKGADDAGCSGCPVAASAGAALPDGSFKRAQRLRPRRKQTQGTAAAGRRADWRLRHRHPLRGPGSGRRQPLAGASALVHRFDLAFADARSGRW